MINPDTLRRHRTLAGLSQRTLAKNAGLGPLGIKRLEDGADASRLPLAVIVRIADALDVTIQQLLDTHTAATASSVDSLPQPEPLNYHQAKLLRRLHRGEDITHRLTSADRELTLPSMLRSGIIDITAMGARCSTSTDRALELLSRGEHSQLDRPRRRVAD